MHPSSSAIPAATSARRPIPPFSQTRVSGVAASPYSRASQFSARGTSQREEITTSFGEDDASPSLTRKAVVDAAGNDDVVYGEDGDEVLEPQRTVRDVFHDEQSVAGFNSEGQADWQYPDAETPMPKRRKVSRPQIDLHEPINISSSPSDVMPHSPAISESGDDGLSPAKPATPHTTSRFRAAGPPVNVQDDHRSSRPAFKAVESRSSTLDILGSVLPEAFTPSRRKGKHDYLHGGLADTVRSWVLQISTEESQRGNRYEQETVLSAAAVDRSRRSITATDSSGTQWLLAGSQPWSSTSISRSSVERMNEGKEVTIRGSSTTWTVPLQSLGLGPNIRVAGQWDLSIW